MATGVNADAANHINREAGDKQKGFRFQKLRAAIRFLERVESNSTGQVLCAIELLEDSLLYDSSSAATIQGEENKAYSTAISFNSSAIRNTVVAFLDLYFAFRRSPELKLSVYASAAISQERIEAVVREELGFDKKQGHYDILRKLVAKESLSSEEEFIAYHIAQKEYKAQYEGKSSGYFSLFAELTVKDVCDFLQSIEWSVSEETNMELEEQALAKIRSCRFFTHRHEGLESFILSSLLDALEKRSEIKDSISRLVGTDGLKLIFNEVLGNALLTKPLDPAANAWGGIDLHDARNLSEKIQAVSPQYPTQSLQRLARKCALAKAEVATRSREYSGLRRRILDVCESEMEKIGFSSALTPTEINDRLESLTKASLSHFSTLAQSYSYQAKDEHSIKGAVLTLFDECYLAFDENDGNQEK